MNSFSELFEGFQSIFDMMKGDSEWFEGFLVILSKETNLPYETLKDFIREEVSLPECINYVQLGNPENILITR